MTTLIEKLNELPKIKQSESGGGGYVHLPSVIAIIEEHKRESWEAIDLATGLNAVADMGFWPQVIYDDNGNWAIWDEGSANMRLYDDQDYRCSFLIPSSYFRPSLQEAWMLYVDRLEELGNDVTNLKNSTSPQPSHTQLIGELVQALEDDADAASCWGLGQYRKELLTKAREAIKT